MKFLKHLRPEGWKWDNTVTWFLHVLVYHSLFSPPHLAPLKIFILTTTKIHILSCYPILHKLLLCSHFPAGQNPSTVIFKELQQPAPSSFPLLPLPAQLPFIFMSYWTTVSPLLRSALHYFCVVSLLGMPSPPSCLCIWSGNRLLKTLTRSRPPLLYINLVETFIQ